jgi:ribosomal protein S18 acetylase RimI-like enzyme
MSNEWKKGWDRLFCRLMEKGMKFYLGYFEGKPAGISALLSLGKIGGIFNVGTLKEYRRRGIGTALTVYALKNSIFEGNDLHTLQTAKGGEAERLYKKIGFEIDHTISFFTKDLRTKD